ncbi:serine kinase [Pedobacter sp. L105]|uniref:serine kinase n=1 Tax=Pedobacter sp. L105 TaxID=1641871 RepID=UPI00131AB012|nr:serine kinase [Pedobacter sp. L105]
MYSYWGFGLHIKSDIEFPELLPVTFGSADLSIYQGKVPRQLEGENLVKMVKVSMNENEYLHAVPGVADYYASNGQEICVEAHPGADEKSIRLFLLSNAIAAILHQRNRIPMHASAICHEDGIVLFCGRSGAGKSTTVTTFQKKGSIVFSDDVCVLENDNNGELVALPSYPMIKLWEDSFAKIGLETAEEKYKIRPELAKYARFYHDEFDISPRKIKQVYILDPENRTDNVEIKKLGPLAGFKLLQQNTYRYVQMNGMKKRNIHFAMISKLAAEVPVFQISRPSHGNTIDAVIDLINANLLHHD